MCLLALFSQKSSIGIVTQHTELSRVDVCVCVCVRACVRACVCVCGGGQSSMYIDICVSFEACSCDDLLYNHMNNYNYTLRWSPVPRNDGEWRTWRTVLIETHLCKVHLIILVISIICIKV